jgi:hypothetical protein
MADDMAACKTATLSIKVMMDQLQALWPRQHRFEWNISKLHEQFHVPFDIHRHGNHKNVHTAPQEHNHATVKHAALKTQLNKRTLDHQTGMRILDRIIIQRAYDCVVVVETTKKKIMHQPGRNGSKGKFRFRSTPDNGQWAADAWCIWKKPKHDGLLPLHHAQLMSYLGSELMGQYGQIRHEGGINERIKLDCSILSMNAMVSSIKLTQNIAIYMPIVTGHM